MDTPFPTESLSESVLSFPSVEPENQPQAWAETARKRVTRRAKGFQYPMRPSDEWRIRSLIKNPMDWYWQPKYNGWHVLALPDGRLFTRHGQDISDWPGVQGIRRKLHCSVPVVGELLNGFSHDGIQALQKGGVGTLMIFDMVTHGTFADRSMKLNQIRTTPRVVEIAATVLPCRSWEGIESALTSQLAAEHEGIVLKHRNGLYELGKSRSVESRQQVKLKSVKVLQAAGLI